MILCRTPSDVREAIAAYRAGLAPASAVTVDSAAAGAGQPVPAPGGVALVPTMGYLHEGHLSLVDRARQRAGLVVASIFVNQLQFGAGEDLDRYPRDLARDQALAEHRGVDLLFAPGDDVMYPAGDPVVRIVAGRLADRLCGAYRPGHFEGVLTVVAKLFNIIRPDLAVFGQKDYQQAVLVRRMVADLDFPVAIDLAPIVREPDGLAMSSRNVYLSPSDRARAIGLHRALLAALRAFRAGEREATTLVGRARRVLEDEHGVTPQYIELVHPDTLDLLSEAVDGSVLAVAAYFAATRLIDNIVLQ